MYGVGDRTESRQSKPNSRQGRPRSGLDRPDSRQGDLDNRVIRTNSRQGSSSRLDRNTWVDHSGREEGSRELGSRSGGFIRTDSRNFLLDNSEFTDQRK